MIKSFLTCLFRRFSVFSEPMRRVEPTNMTQLRPEKFITRRRSTLVNKVIFFHSQKL